MNQWEKKSTFIHVSVWEGIHHSLVLSIMIVAQYLQPIPALRHHYQGLAKPRLALHQQGNQFNPHPRLAPIAGEPLHSKAHD